ncbi:putative flavin-nucleotide-binding protein [Aminobacter sp. MSH1]|uniref:pyridoxamine 5'-phosphate oxidase family protein n=1 Tax=Aminobacter sp. MSH1 TaxID=374606 RepID=UPI000D354014|nr:pyridoxamine 5'-phosphate oxidase family protein [Aminobacter sp. MSH1]AWC20804.1 putative flavin-nucleotide-binding protein [Aminobacter sp. MSH1]
MIVQETTREENISFLSSRRFGRLACAKDNQPYLVPFHYAVSENHLYGFSMPGQKIDWMRKNAHVCVQVDEFSANREWRSVIVYGVYEEMPDTPQWQRNRSHALSSLQQHANWWEPGDLKPASAPPATAVLPVFFRIRIESLTGRHAFDQA